MVTQDGSVLLVETVRKSGLDQAISAALTPWRKPRAVHDPGKILLGPVDGDFPRSWSGGVGGAGAAATGGGTTRLDSDFLSSGAGGKLAIMIHTTGNITGRAVTRGGTAPLRLFCFHHAGGSAWSFAGWGQRLGREIEVVPVSLPPRPVPAPGSAASVGTMGDLVRQVTQRLAPALDEQPYAFYGHSMGVLVAHGVAQRQLTAGRRPPAGFVTAAHRAPHLPAPDLTMDLSDTSALELLLGLGGAGRLLLENPGRMRAVVDRLRQDLLISASYRYPAQEHRPLPCPVNVLHGSRDPLVPTAHAAAWKHHATGSFSLRVLPGGHFFHKEHKELFFEELRRALRVGSPVISGINYSAV